MIKTNIEYNDSDSIMIMCDNRDSTLYKEIKEINIKYCIKHRINFIYYSSYDINISPYWWKVFIIRDIMVQRPDTIKYICWMDSDALVFDVDKHFKYFFNVEPEQVYFIGPKDTISNVSLSLKLSKKLGKNSTFQASVFFIINNSTTIQMFNDWVASYDPTKFILHKNKIKYIGTQPYGALDYEQGNFVQYIIPTYYKHIKLLRAYTLNSSIVRPHVGKHWSLHFQIIKIYYRYKAIHYK